MRQKLVPFIDEKGIVWDYFFVDLTTGILYFERRINKRRIKFSTKTKNPLAAKRFANAEFERRLGRKTAHVRKLIRYYSKIWLDIKETEGLDMSTLYGIRRAYNEINEFWGDMLPSEITRENLAKFYSWWAQNKSHQMENVLKWFKNFSKFLHETVEGGMPALPAVPKIRDPNREKILIDRKKKKERTLTLEEFSKIRKAAANEDEETMAILMFTMATRVEETCGLDFARTILLDEPVPVYRWFIGQNKADHFGQHALHLSLIPRLLALRERRKKEGTTLLFPQERNNQQPLRSQMIDWEGWRSRANLGWHWTAHTFRHSCLTMLFNDERNPQATICKQYRVSLDVALDTYVKTTREAMLRIRDAIGVKP